MAPKLSPLWHATLDDHVVALTWEPNGNRLAAAAVGGPVTLFDATGAVSNALAGHGFGATAVAWSADGGHLATAGQDGKAKLWDLVHNKERLMLQGGAAWVERLAWCPVVNLLATAAGKRVRLWDVQGQLVREFPDHPSTVADIQWQPKAEILASAAYGQLNLWRIDSAEPMRRFEWRGSMLALAWSPNGKHLATGDQDCTVHFWHVKTGDDLMMSGYPSKVKELSWDASSRYLATGGGHIPCVWDCSGTGPANTMPIQLEAHTERVTALAFQHHGPLLASGGADGLATLWQPENSDKPLSVVELAATVTQLAWAADDRRLAVGMETGEVVVYAIG